MLLSKTSINIVRYSNLSTYLTILANSSFSTYFLSQCARYSVGSTGLFSAISAKPAARAFPTCFLRYSESIYSRLKEWICLETVKYKMFRTCNHGNQGFSEPADLVCWVLKCESTAVLVRGWFSHKSHGIYVYSLCRPTLYTPGWN